MTTPLKCPGISPRGQDLPKPFCLRELALRQALAVHWLVWSSDLTRANVQAHAIRLRAPCLAGEGRE